MASISFPSVQVIAGASAFPPANAGWQGFYGPINYATPSTSTLLVDDVLHMTFPEIAGYDVGGDVQQLVYAAAQYTQSKGKKIYQLTVWRIPPSGLGGYIGTGIDQYWVKLRHAA